MKDITGKKFGRLTAIKFIKRKRYKYYWEFSCSCGKVKIIRKDSVILKDTISCGCYCRENNRRLNTTHGFSIKDKRFYGIWRKMINRCLNKKISNYKRYGGRGIKVCNRWLEFENFRDDMYKSYLEHIEEFNKENTTIDRINNEGNYRKNNCKWATMQEQSNNRRNNHLITYNNQTMTIAQWARKLNINLDTLNSRLLLYKWSVKKSFITPVKH